MKRSYALLFFIGIFLITLVVLDENRHRKGESLQNNSISTVQIDGISYVHIDEINKSCSTQSDLDMRNRTVVLRGKPGTYSFVSEVPVVNHNGVFEAIEKSPVFKNNDVWLPFSFYSQLVKSAQSDMEPREARLEKMNAKELTHYLSFLQSPIQGARVSTVDSSLPGATRGYRNGFHEGIDWYSYVCGITIDEKTQVTSVADGTVVRVDHKYKELSLKERQNILKIAGQESKTPEYILDKLRGRSVWVQHKKGVLCRYVHLSSVSRNLKVGDKIRAGDFIGNVGNSGTSEGVANKKEGLHLHLDILLYGNWHWDRYTVKERRQILEETFNPKVC